MKLHKPLLAIASLVLLTGYSLSSGRDLAVVYNPQISHSTDGIVRTGITVGPISNFEDLVVNGIEYTTDNASFTIDGLPGTEADLDVGQTVTITGTIVGNVLTNKAVVVSYNDNVSGPIESVDVDNDSMVILGQTVRVDDFTSFDENMPSDSLEDLATGSFVEVNGLVDSNGVITATRVRSPFDASQLDVLGEVANLDPVARTFAINAAVVDFSTAILENFTDGQLANGKLVEVQGAQLGSNGVLMADRIVQRTSTVVGNLKDRIELQGFITKELSEFEFIVDSNQVRLTQTTEFENGDATDLSLDTRLEIEGVFDAQGVIVASIVKFYQPPLIRIEAPITAVDGSALTLEVLGISIEVNAETRMEDKSNLSLDPLSLQDLGTGDYVEIRGVERLDSGFDMRALLLEREDPSDRVRLQGFVQAATELNIQILNVNCDTSGAEFYSLSGQQISATEFLSQLNDDSLVKVSGLQTGVNSLLVDKVEFESAD